MIGQWELIPWMASYKIVNINIKLSLVKIDQGNLRHITKGIGWYKKYKYASILCRFLNIRKSVFFGRSWTLKWICGWLWKAHSGTEWQEYEERTDVLVSLLLQSTDVFTSQQKKVEKMFIFSGWDVS